MGKLTLEQKISKIEDLILKEETIIEESKEKVKELKAELKTLQDEKEKEYANELMKIIKENGIDQKSLLNELKNKNKSVSVQ